MFINILWTIYTLSIIGIYTLIISISKKLKRENGKIKSNYKKTIIERIALIIPFTIISLIPIINTLAFFYLTTEECYEGIENELYNK